MITGIVLAAGAGTRYGLPKVLAADGRWLQAAVDALHGGGCDEILVVLGAAEAPIPEGAQRVLAIDWAGGLSASLRAGLAAASGSAAVITLVDTPDVHAAVVARVLAGAPLARAVYDGRPGHPVVIAREHWDAVSRSATGDSGARAFLASRTDVVAVECGDLATGVDHDRSSGCSS